MKGVPVRASFLRSGFYRQLHEASHVLRSDLNSDGGNQRIDAKFAKVLVEILELRGQRDRLDPGLRVARSIRLAIALSPAGSASRAM